MMGKLDESPSDCVMTLNLGVKYNTWYDTGPPLSG